MAETKGNEDSLLLLELGLETDESEFDKARYLLGDLTQSMRDLSVDFSLDGMISGLKNAAEVLRLLVQQWNSLEDKAIQVSYNTNNYLPYNISPGLRQNITNRVGESKLAEQFGITDETILSDLRNIIGEQSSVMVQGDAYNPAPFIAITRLAEKLGVGGFSGDDISNMLLHMPTEDVYTKLTGLLSTAYRKAYTYSDSSAEREDLLQFIEQVLKTSFVDKSIGDYLAYMTMPENPTYGKSGNPIYRYFSSTIEDEGPYMDKLKQKGANFAETSEDISVLKSEAREGLNQLILTASNFFGKQFVLPFMQDLNMVTSVIGGKREGSDLSSVPEVFNSTSYETMGYSIKLTNAPFSNASASDKAYFASRFGLSSNWVGGVEDSIKRKNNVIASLPLDAISQELGSYELWRMGLNTYEQDARFTTGYVIDKLYHSDAFSSYKRSKKRYQAIYEALQDPESPYYLPESSGFLPMYSMLYSTGAMSEEAFLETMAKVFENTNMANIAKRYGVEYTTGNDIIKAETTKGADNKLQLILTIRDEASGNTHTETITADKLNDIINVGFKDPLR